VKIHVRVGFLSLTRPSLIGNYMYKYMYSTSGWLGLVRTLRTLIVKKGYYMPEEVL